MRTLRLSRFTAAALFVTTLSGTAATAAIGAGTPAGAASLPSCNLKTLANHSGLVNITFWESASQANLTVLQGITSAFNSSQTKVHVTLVTQAGYDDTWNKYTAGLSNGQLPDVVQLEDQRTQAAIDTGSFLPVQSCMNAAKYSTSDYLPRPLAYWKVNGVQWAMPFAVSAPILYYNQNAFTKAGLDRPAGHADPDGGRRQGAEGVGQRHGPGPGPLAPRDVAGLGQPALRQQQERPQRPRHRSGVQQQDLGVDLQPAEHAGPFGLRHDQPGHGARPVRQPARHRQRQVRHDPRDLGGARHRDPAPRQRQVRQREAGHRRLPRLQLVGDRVASNPAGRASSSRTSPPPSTRRRRGSSSRTS